MASVNGIGAQRCNASITAIRYSSPVVVIAVSDSKSDLGATKDAPVRSKLTITVMSMGLACDAGGGLQHVFTSRESHGWY